MKASDYIVSFLERKGIDTIFGYIGGMVTHLVDSINNNPNVKFIQTYHEQTAAIAAEGYAIETGNFGVAVSTSGPGVTNMITGIADAYFGSIPVLYITGQVNTYEYKYDKPIRQQGFQEMDVVSVVKPITKYAVMVDKAENLRYELEKAVYIATTGRKGPVVIDLPMDISRAELDIDELEGFKAESYAFPEIDWVNIVSIIESAKRPILLLGGGSQGYTEDIEKFLHKFRMPVVTSLMGRGAINEAYDYYVGMIGSYGNRSANMVIAKSDLVIAIGSRLDTRQTGAMISKFLPNGKIIQVDIDVNELENHRLDNRFVVNCNTSIFLQEMLNRINLFDINRDWLKWILIMREKYGQKQEVERFVDNKTPYLIMYQLNKVLKEGDVIVTDIGQNQMWAAQTICLGKDQKFITSGGLAPMGFALPAAIGVAFANTKKTIYCICGDGGLQMAMQSLLLISQYKLNIKVIILNNESLGMITQFQHLYFNDRMPATTFSGGYHLPNFELLAKSFYIPYYKIESIDEPRLLEALSNDYVFIDFIINGLTSVSPKLEYNKPIYSPTPDLPGDEMIEYLNLF